ncbi:MAG: phage tail assembly protein [Dehalococcoidia bacterium]
MPGLQTEFEFTLPRGYVDGSGTLHRKGTMRLATANDEIAPLRDPRVRNNQAYLVIILLARVVTRLGTIDNVTTHEVENLFTGDLAFLQRLYRQINEHATSLVEVTCPHCNEAVEVDLSELGGSQATPSDDSTRR